MEIRLARPEDIPGILELLRQIGELHGKGRPDLFCAHPLKYDATELEEMLAEESRPILTAVSEEKVVGYAFCVFQNTKGNEVLKEDYSLYVDDLCVDESCRGQGIGRQLWQEICRLGADRGARRILLNVWAFNESAMAFYRSCGMQPQRIMMEQVLEESDADKKPGL